ncbi:MAG TPA: glycosyltransferase family 39 protein, partial [Isosphaeraceae bacterium]|nr:glycosyltransferase family 39 protein [Isosphaeraceae bacterium]
MTTPLTGRAWWIGCGLTFALALLVLMPTTGDFGVTYDEPAYRYSQMLSIQWWERLAQVRSANDLKPLLEPDALLYYWPYARHGINFHPPLAGQLNLATYGLMGGWWKDIPARRLATVLEFALTVTVLFGFLARRYGAWVGASAAGCLLLMPRLYGQAHLIDTDVPGLCLWALASIAFWNGLYAPKRGRWRIALGILLGLAFVEKMGAVLVLLPILFWLAAARLPKAFRGPERLSCWVDASLTLPVLLAPLALAFVEILRLKTKLPPPQFTDLFVNRPASYLPGAGLALPLLLWLVRRALARLFRSSPVWGTERPGLETLEAIIAFAPVVGWLGNPAWWRETLPRLTHYYMLNTARRGALPDILILYLGQTYKYSLPWHNAWVLMAVTVPVLVLLMALVGLVRKLRTARTDALPLFCLLNLLVLPVMRMLPTPAHDGVRLFLPSFFFLAAFAGWGIEGLSDLLARLARRPPRLFRAALMLLVLGDSAWQLWAIHPFELSYYNRLVGGPSGAWHRGFELTYWYDAFTPEVIDQLNRKLPEGAYVTFMNDLSSPSTFQELQSLGHLRGDIHLESPPGNDYPYAWLLT